MQDLIGRRYVTLVGGSSLCLGIILLATAHTFAQGVIGMAFAGAGAAVGELTALAGYVFALVSELSADHNIGWQSSYQSRSEVSILLW
jgi:MFS family permease